MADLSIPSPVQGSGVATTVGGTAGTGGGSAGKAMIEGADGRWILGDSNADATKGERKTGIALNTAAENQPITIILVGRLVTGAAVVVGEAYYLSNSAGASNAAGGLMPRADLITGTYPNLVAYGVSATEIQLLGAKLAEGQAA